MQIDGNISAYVFNKNKPAKIYHVISVSQEASVSYDITGVCAILDAANAIVVDNVELLFDRVYRHVSDGLNYFYVNIAADISQAIIDIVSGVYKLRFNISITADGTAHSNISEIYEFELLEATPEISINAEKNAEISAESINNKLSDLVMPGVLYGLDVIKGSGHNMFNLLPGAAVAKNGMRFAVAEENHNVFKAYDLPEHDYRIDAVCIFSNGSLGVFKGLVADGQPEVDESDKTVIAYLYLSSSMLSVSEAKIIKRESISAFNNFKKRRIYNRLLEGTPGGENAILYLGDEASINSIALYKNNKRLSRFDYDIIPGANTAVAIHDSLDTDVFMAVFDLLKNIKPSDEDLFTALTPAPKAYPWDNAEILFRNPWLNAVRLPGDTIITDWNNTGLQLSNQMAISRFTQLSPNALLTSDNGMKLPINDVNKINAIILLPTATKQPHTFVLYSKISQLRDAMLLSSNSYEPGAKFNFSVNIINVLGSAKFVLSHLNSQVEHNAMFNTKYAFAFRFDGESVSIFVNNIKLIEEPSSSFSGLDSLNEIYLKNEADPTIYYAGYWGEALYDSDIFAIHNALHASQLI